MNTIEQNIFTIKKLIANALKKYDREQDSVLLLAASKGQSVEKIMEATQAGQYLFGENYLQEALTKMNALSQQQVSNEIEWHFIGPVQSNKTKKIAEHFAWVHSVDDNKIAKRLNDQRPQHLPPLNICIQVNVDDEATKSGVDIDHVLPLAEFCLSLPRLRLRGLMTIPKEQTELTLQRRTFHQLFLLKQSLSEKGFSLDTLSMGMSHDFEAAIAEGSTLIRIGTAIFGSRT